MVAIYSQMLQRKYGNTLDAQASEYLNFAVQGAQRMEMLLKDLLTYTQVANTVENHITEPVNASQPLEQALENHDIPPLSPINRQPSPSGLRQSGE